MTTDVFEMLAATIVYRHEDNLFNDGPDVQIERAVKALERVHRVTPLTPVSDTYIDLAGFGQADVRFASGGEQYLLLSDVADALGWPIWTACDWARLQQNYAVQDQRRADEERGDGRIGWDYMLDHIDLELDFCVDNPEAKPDARGQRWSQYGDWLITRDRLPSAILASPWSREFMDNTMPHFGHIARKVWGPQMGAVFNASGMTEEEALRRARRGPAGAWEDTDEN